MGFADQLPFVSLLSTLSSVRVDVIHLSSQVAISSPPSPRSCQRSFSAEGLASGSLRLQSPGASFGPQSSCFCGLSAAVGPSWLACPII